jgi:hypothetical protein
MLKNVIRMRRMQDMEAHRAQSTAAQAAQPDPRAAARRDQEEDGYPARAAARTDRLQEIVDRIEKCFASGSAVEWRTIHYDLSEGRKIAGSGVEGDLTDRFWRLHSRMEKEHEGHVKSSIQIEQYPGLRSGK